jgi:hypothetical protein
MMMKMSIAENIESVRDAVVVAAEITAKDLPQFHHSDTKTSLLLSTMVCH